MDTKQLELNLRKYNLINSGYNFARNHRLYTVNRLLDKSERLSYSQLARQEDTTSTNIGRLITIHEQKLNKLAELMGGEQR